MRLGDIIAVAGAFHGDFDREPKMGLYSHYDGAHNHPVNRALHMIAIPIGFSSVIVIWWHWLVGLLLVPTAFALAWLRHLIEGNKPAFLTNPVHVLVAPLWLVKKVLGIAPKKAD
jgi:hypothetical protein